MPRDVIFVPGLPGSELFAPGPQGGRTKIFVRVLRRLGERLLWKVDPRLLGPNVLTDPDPVEAGDPVEKTRILIVDLKQARRLYEILRGECGLARRQIHKVGWDWRRPAADGRASHELTAAIQAAPVGSVLIVHSTGGLIVRSVLAANRALCNRLSAVVAFGVPWIGTLKSMAILLKRESLQAADKNDARRVIAHSWSAIDLLPRRDAGLTVKGNGQPYDLFDSVDWLPERPLWLRTAVKQRLDHSLRTLGVPSPRWQFPVDLHNVAGFGELTTVAARIALDGVRFNVTPSGADLDFEAVRQGDGTIPFRSAASAQGPRVTNWRIPIGAYRKMGKKKHASLWANPGAVKMLRHVVGEQALEPLVELALDTSAYSPGTRIRLRYSLQDARGRPMGGRLRILTPSSPLDETEFPTDPEGFGTMVFPRTRFARTRKFRRVRAELSSAAGRTEVFALVPA